MQPLCPHTRRTLIHSEHPSSHTSPIYHGLTWWESSVTKMSSMSSLWPRRNSHRRCVSAVAPGTPSEPPSWKSTCGSMISSAVLVIIRKRFVCAAIFLGFTLDTATSLSSTAFFLLGVIHDTQVDKRRRLHQGSHHPDKTTKRCLNSLN